MKKILFSFSLLLFLFVSCSDSDKDTRPNPKPDPKPTPEKNPYATGVDLSSSTFVKWNDANMEDDYFMLGYGYDVTGKYAHPAGVRKKIVDIKKYKTDYDGAITFLQAGSSSAELSYYGSLKDARETLAAKAAFSASEIAKYKNLFRGMFESQFKNDTSFPNIDYYYSGYSGMHLAYILRFLYMERQFAERYLTDEFNADIQTKSGEEIIKLYGTHVLREIYVGSRIDYTYRSTDSNASNRNTWLGYNAWYYLDRPSNITMSKPDTDSPLKENIYVEAVDGTMPNPNVWMIDITNGGKKVKSSAWDDMTDKNLTLIDFSSVATETNSSLIPIYKMVIDPVKQAEVRTAYERYLSK